MMRALALLALLLASSGCASFRGIPSHGGGKRFDEEQRIVAGAIRHAVSDMRFSELAGKRVKVLLTSIPTSGSGNLNPGGLQDITLGLSEADTVEDLVRAYGPLNVSGSTRTRRWDDQTETWENFQQVDQRSQNNAKILGDNTEETRTTRNTGLRYSLDHSYFTQKENTQGDVAYLQAVLDMKANHDGVAMVGAQPGYVLHVLVDVLGTNRRRRDFVFWKRDDLAATCEMTYYARDVKNGELAFTARRAAGWAVYVEDRVWPLGIERVGRDFRVQEVTPYPVSCSDEDRLVAHGHSNGSSHPPPKAPPVQEDPGSADLLVERARSQLRMGNRKDAFQSLNEVINLEPTHPGLQEIRDEFNIDLSIP